MPECLEVLPILPPSQVKSSSAPIAFGARTLKLYQRLADKRLTACLFVCLLTLGARAIRETPHAIL